VYDTQAMKVVIVGDTHISLLISEALHRSHDVTVICPSQDHAASFDTLDIQILRGDGIDPTDLKLAKADRADAFVACTASDDVNVLSCLAAKSLGAKKTLAFVTRQAKKTLAFVTRQHYIEAFAPKGLMDSVGVSIDRIIWPQRILAQQIVDIIHVPRALETASLADGKVELVEYKLEANDVYTGQILKDNELPNNTLVVGLISNQEFVVPSGDTVLTAGDKVMFMGTKHSMQTLEDTFAPRKRNMDVVIIGGGNVGFMVAEQLKHDRGTNVTVVEKDAERCNKLSQHLKHSMILQGDGTDLELLEQERVEDADVLVAVTSDDSNNLLVALLGKQLNIPKVITRVNRGRNRRLFENVGIESPLTPLTAAVQEVFNWLKVDQVDHLANIGDQAEVMEVTYPYDCLSAQIKDIGPPPNSLIGAILRKDKVIIPDGETTLQRGDHLLIVTTPDNVESVHGWLEHSRQLSQ